MEFLLWLYEGFFVLPLDKSPPFVWDWAGAWRRGAGKHIQRVLGCLPGGSQRKSALGAHPRQQLGLGGLVGNSPPQPDRNLLWGHSHEHDGPVLTLLTVFHSLPIRECERSLFGRCKKIHDSLVLFLRKAETQDRYISFKGDCSYCYRNSTGPRWTPFLRTRFRGGRGLKFRGFAGQAGIRLHLPEVRAVGFKIDCRTSTFPALLRLSSNFKVYDVLYIWERERAIAKLSSQDMGLV